MRIPQEYYWGTNSGLNWILTLDKLHDVSYYSGLLEQEPFNTANIVTRPVAKPIRDQPFDNLISRSFEMH